MQTPKARSSPSEVPHKSSLATPRTARQGNKTPGSDSDSVSSHPGSKTPKERSPKVIERRSPRNPALEKKRPSGVSELESQLAQLQEDLKKAKELLSSSESCKRQAQQEAEEAKQHFLAMSAKLEESQQQLLDFSTSEDHRVQELREISHDRDLAWQSELKAVQKQHSMDTAALASAMNEIQKLKVQLEFVAGSEASQTKRAELAYAEIHHLRQELAETLSLVKNLKAELSVFKVSEAGALEVVSKTQAQLETVKKTEAALRLDGLKATDAYESIAVELDQSKVRVNALEGLADIVNCNSKNSADPSCKIECANENGVNEDSDQLKAELNLVRVEASQLRSALDAAEVRYQEEYIHSTLQIRSAYEQVERAKSESCLREAELKSELEKAKANIDELKTKLMDKETELQGIVEENEGLSLKIEKSLSSKRESEMEMELKLKKLVVNLVEMKASSLDKEAKLQRIIGESEMLKLEIKERDMDRNTMEDGAVAAVEAAKASEQEALVKLGYLTEEADKHSRRAARVAEQLDAAQAVNSEVESELRRLKVQSDQWRKAAEAAATMLSAGGNGKFVERMGSLDSTYQTIGGKMALPYSDDTDDDDSPKKKNRNVLKKIGVLWKKGQK